MSENAVSTTNDIPTGYRWVVLLWGILSIVIGLLLLFRPVNTALIWVQIMAIFWLVGGIFDLVQAVVERGAAWVWRVILSILSIGAGLFILSQPVLGTVVTVQIMFILLAVDGILLGIMNIATSFRPKLQLGRLLLGALQLLVGGWLLLHPLVGMLALVPILGAVSITGGILAIILSFQLRN